MHQLALAFLRGDPAAELSRLEAKAAARTGQGPSFGDDTSRATAIVENTLDGGSFATRTFASTERATNDSTEEVAVVLDQDHTSELFDKTAATRGDSAKALEWATAAAEAGYAPAQWLTATLTYSAAKAAKESAMQVSI
jgi:hypothetical protein